MGQVLWLVFFILHFSEAGGAMNSGSMAWVAYVFMMSCAAYCRTVIRGKYNVYGSMLEDLWLGLTMWPFVLNQTALMVENNGEGAPLYITEIDRAFELSAQLAAKKGSSKAVPETATA